MKKIIVVAIFMLLVGCGPKEGLVIDKHWKPDMSYWDTHTTCTVTNGRQRCTTSPFWNHHPAEYHLILKTPEGKIKDKSVSKQIYYNINVGDYYRS